MQAGLPDGFFVQVTKRRGTPLVRVGGELDLSAAPTVRAALHALIDAGASDVLIDLGAVTFIDSTGIAALVVATRAGLRVRVIAASSAVDRVLELSGLHDALRPAPSRSRADAL